MKTSAAALALVLVGGLAGCSGAEEQPRTLPPVAVSPSPTVAAVPSPPAEALAETPQGASAFARYWLTVVERSIAVGDATGLRALSDDGCGGCNNLIEAAEGGADGERIRGAEFVVDFAEAPPVENGETLVTLRYSRAAGELIGADGEVTPFAPEGPIDAQMRVQRRAGSWVVLGFRGTPV